MLAVPAVLAVGTATNNGVIDLTAAIPTTLTGPIIHFAHGRYVPGVISFFGWASVAATTFFGAGVAALTSFNNDTNNNGSAVTVAVGVAIGATGGALMTWLDVYLARSVAISASGQPPSTMLAPAFVPLRGGAMGSVVGKF